MSNVLEDENDTVYSFFGGYQFNEYVAIQGGYTDFGESTFSGTSSGGPSWDPGPVSAVHEADGWELGVLGRWPITQRWYALGFVGYLWWESKEAFVESTGTSSISESGSDVTTALALTTTPDSRIVSCIDSWARSIRLAKLITTSILSVPKLCIDSRNQRGARGFVISAIAANSG